MATKTPVTLTRDALLVLTANEICEVFGVTPPNPRIRVPAQPNKIRASRDNQATVSLRVPYPVEIQLTESDIAVSETESKYI